MHQVLNNEWDRLRAEANIIIVETKIPAIIKEINLKKKRVVKFETFDRFC